jgi:PKD repeat protein
MFYDTRNSSGRSGTDVYYAMSTDGGQNWGAATRLTTVTSRNVTDSFEWGDYNGMDMASDNIMAIYTDNRDETGGTAQSVDVYGIGGFAPSGGNVAPTANFSFTTSALTANFTDSSTDSDGTISSRSWNFGDGGTSTATNPSRTYAAAGTYNVTLTVTDNQGATGTITKPVTVTQVANQAPVANYTFTTSNLTATFTNTSTDADGTIASSSWNFGDGATSTATSPSRTYAAAGTYSVALTVTDNQGATNTVTKSVTVTAPPGNVLANGVAVTGLGASTGAYLKYTMVVPGRRDRAEVRDLGRDRRCRHVREVRQRTDRYGL